MASWSRGVLEPWRTSCGGALSVGKLKTQKSEGRAEELGGKLKKVAGKAIGNAHMEAEGKAKELASRR